MNPEKENESSRETTRMPVPLGSRVYIDTMVWIYHLINPKHHEYRHCAAFLKDLEEGKFTGLATTFVVHEALDVAKRELAKANEKEPTLQELVAVQERIEKTLDKFGVEQHDADRLAFPAEAPSLFERSGEVIMRSGAYCSSGKWKSVGGADAIHVSFAEMLEADYYATCDTGFKKLSAKVKPTILREVYP